MKFFRFFLLAAIAALLTGSIECEIKEITAAPGEEVSIPLTVKNDERNESTFQLSYSFWYGEAEGYFYYNGQRVNSLRLNSSESADLTFKFFAPEEPGRYYLYLYADGSAGVTVNVELPEKPLRISLDNTGIVAEGGDVVEVNALLENTLNSPIEVDLSCDAPKGWECRFYDGDVEVYRTVVGEGGKHLRVQVDIDSTTDVGKYAVTLHIGPQTKEFEVFVKESHAGEKGEVRLRVVDKDGEGVASARITAGNETFFTSGDGEAIFEVEPGTYDLKIEKGGYYEKTIRDVKVRGGRTNDLGTVFLEKKAYYAEISVSSSRITVSIGDVASLNVRIENRGYGEDQYALSLEGLPPEFTYNFREGELAVSEVYLEGGEEKDITLEIYTPATAEVGDYSLKIVAKGKYTAEKDLKLSVVGRMAAYFSLEGGMYTVKASQGEELELKGYVVNSGRGVTLTNVKVKLELPQGWSGEVSPEVIPSVKPGERGEVNLRIRVPPDAKPSEYRITVETTSDQVTMSDRISVVVGESSAATFVGLGIIAVTILALIILIKKVGRR